MPRLTNTTYLQMHRLVRSIWNDNLMVFGYVSHSDQRYLHQYFQPDSQPTDLELLAHRRRVSKKAPSLPQCAGRAFSHLLVAERRVAEVRVRTDRPRVIGDKRRLVVRSALRPDIDIERIAKVVVSQILEAAAAAVDADTSRPTDEPKPLDSARSAWPWSVPPLPALQPQRTAPRRRRPGRSGHGPWR